MTLCGIVAAGILANSMSTVGASKDTKVTRHVLKNGLTVILQENHASPVVAFNVWVKVGSGDERDEESGIAHVLEHMVFKGTQRRKVGQIAQEVEAAGGDINAFTSFDQTVYHICLASRFFDTGLDIMADAIQNSTFEQSELKKELEVVLEEVRRGEDIPSRRLFQALFAEAYQIHPYRRPVIGTTETIKSFSRQDIVDFFRKWYVPSNMALVVTGDFKAKEVLPKIYTAFESWSATDFSEQPRKSEPSQSGLRIALLKDDVQEAHLNIAFHISDLKHEDSYALDVLALIAGQGESSRLYRQVKDKAGLVHTVYSSSYTPKDPGLLVTSAVLETEKATSAIKAILRELYILKSTPPSPDELEKAKLNIEADFVFQKETVQGQAQSLGYFETVVGNLDFEQHYVDRIRSLKSRDIQKVAEKYLRPENMTLALLIPDRASDSVKEADIRRAVEATETIKSAGVISGTSGNKNSYSSPAEATPSGQKGMGVHREILSNGTTLIVKENPSVPTVAIRAIFLGGTRFETGSQNGINNFIADMLTRGTQRLNAPAFATLVDSMAASISGSSGRNSLGVTVEGLTRFFNPLLKLLGEVIHQPKFDLEEIEKARRDILAEIKREDDNLSQSAFKLFFRMLYGTHPYALPVNGTIESVNKLKRKELISYYRGLATPDNLVLTVVGDVKTSHVVRKVQEIFGHPNENKASLIDPPNPSPPEAPLQKVISRDKKQAHIAYGFLGTTLKNPDRYPLAILNSVLSGQGGRLFLELRDRQSLAYAVSSFHFEGMEPGALGVYIATSPDKVETALLGIQRELDKICSTLISKEELERAKKYVIGGYEIALQRNASQAADMGFNERYGIGWDEFQQFPERISSVTRKDVLRVAQKYIRTNAPVISMIAPESTDPFKQGKGSN